MWSLFYLYEMHALRYFRILTRSRPINTELRLMCNKINNELASYIQLLVPTGLS
jgi:hypothetical protein